MYDTLVYISDKHIGAIRPDGTGECYPEFTAPNQIYWQMGYIFPDGLQAILWSQEPPRNPNAAYDDPDGGAFATSHLWGYDFIKKTMRELELPPFMGVLGLMPGDERFLICGNLEGITYVYTTDLDGRDRRDIYSGPGYAYGSALSPDGTKLADHLTNNPPNPGYEIYVTDLKTGGRLLIASDEEFLHFAPRWSPDGEWLLYQRCPYKQFPGHERSDICISRADGSEHRVVTNGCPHYFSTAYGTPERHGGGSNMPVWSPDGKYITCTLLLPGSQNAWPYQTDQPDRDHFNRGYHPELAKGGTQVCLIDFETGDITTILDDDPPTWNFRLAWSPDGSKIVFVRADIGEQPGIWVMDADGSNRQFLTNGVDGKGADHARWVSLGVESL